LHCAILANNEFPAVEYERLTRVGKLKFSEAKKKKSKLLIVCLLRLIDDFIPFRSGYTGPYAFFACPIAEDTGEALGSRGQRVAPVSVGQPRSGAACCAAHVWRDKGRRKIRYRSGGGFSGFSSCRLNISDTAD
jgi:hypothetical protein